MRDFGQTLLLSLTELIQFLLIGIFIVVPWNGRSVVYVLVERKWTGCQATQMHNCNHMCVFFLHYNLIFTLLPNAKCHWERKLRSVFFKLRQLGCSSTLRSTRVGQHFADNNFKYIFLNESFDVEFSETYSQGSDQQVIIIGSNNDLAPMGQQSFIWTYWIYDVIVYWHISAIRPRWFHL